MGGLGDHTWPVIPGSEAFLRIRDIDCQSLGFGSPRTPVISIADPDFAARQKLRHLIIVAVDRAHLLHVFQELLLDLLELLIGERAVFIAESQGGSPNLLVRLVDLANASFIVAGENVLP